MKVQAHSSLETSLEYNQVETNTIWSQLENNQNWQVLDKPQVGIKENNVISTNPFVFLVMHFAYYPVRIIKPFYYL